MPLHRRHVRSVAPATALVVGLGEGEADEPPAQGSSHIGHLHEAA
jgi:hypothetical protein